VIAGTPGSTLLLVDDDLAVLVSQAHVLERYGFSTLQARTGQEAIEAIESHPEIDLVLMDVQLGDGIDGGETARRIVEAHDVPIVFVSGHADAYAVSLTEAAPQYGYVLKSSGAAVLANAARSALELHRAHASERELRAELEAALASRTTLLKEVNHRVKNNLMMINALISLHEEAQGVDLSAVKGQLSSVALVHKILHQGPSPESVSAAELLKAILDGVFGSGEGVVAHVHVDVDETRFPLELAVPIGIVTNEIATNALKHAFAGRRGTFRVTLATDSDGTTGVLSLSNDGAPMPETVDVQHPESLGLSLVTALVGQIGGELHIDRAAGTTFSIRYRAP